MENYTKSSDKKMNKIQEDFDKIFAYESEAEKIESDSKLLMAKFLSKIQEVTDEKNINRKELAEMIGTSASYLTQLFRGHKNLNFLTLAKLENALDIKFEISLKEENADVTKIIDKDNHLNKGRTNARREDSAKVFKKRKVTFIPSS